jgi:hypothetical protein
VQRGEKLGTPLRWFNAETDSWSRCEYDMQDALNAKDSTSGLGFLPWRGPVKVQAPVVEPLKLVNTTEAVAPLVVKTAKTAKVKVAKAPKAPKAVKVAKPKAAKNPGFVNGTIFFREDRQKWVAVWNGKQEAARPTAEACMAFLKKKYDFVGNIIS